MQKFTAGCLLGAAVLFAATTGCGIGLSSGDGKHTGPVAVRNEVGYGSFEFIRSNGEIFEMAFDPHFLGPQIHKGDRLGDLIYQDTKDHHEFFIKAILVSEAPPPGRIFYQTGGGCPYNIAVGCEVKNSAYYLWKDGGYHDKPEPRP